MKTFRALLLATPLALAACGDGYELVQTDTIFPYGNQRTAGSGYAYVLAKLLPPKTEPILQPVAPRTEPEPIQQTKQIIEDIPEPVEEPVIEEPVIEEPPEPIAQDPEEIFHEQQMK